MRKINGIATGSLMLLTLAAGSPLYASERVAAGQWEVVSTTDGEAHTFKYCLKPEDATSMNGDEAIARAYTEKHMGKNYKLTKFKADGNSISYTSAYGPVIAETTTTYHRDTFEGVLKTTNNGTVRTTQIRARRLGDCP